jgi:hypothetical protein
MKQCVLEVEIAAKKADGVKNLEVGTPSYRSAQWWCQRGGEVARRRVVQLLIRV